MALTPEDVVNKRFQPTKFREGYDQDEVDDFLDEVVVELRRLTSENDELRQRVSELQQGGGEVAAAPVAAAPVDTAMVDPTSTNNLLQLARRLHEEHVREGVEKKEALIAEGKAAAERILTESNETAERVLAESSATAERLRVEAETKHHQQLAALEQERGTLEHRLDELRSFEREYRGKLRSYIEGQLHELDVVTSGASAPLSAQSAPDIAAAYGSPATPPASASGFAGV